ncbi:hypothetical protein DSL72_007856 [Monilinia vaccinii-corymbosi]|uniref:Uncharacterized protein n=1 Tax=Monilinia vaccinii-corymbosi TaxID=61207 RepID=A0A8A3PJ17_9HELO|nr:hypothetical protein DSL72_007856 [Monilinia vaccinii-corymbosi]
MPNSDYWDWDWNDRIHGPDEAGLVYGAWGPRTRVPWQRGR